jgi:DNA polymerase III delta prime subunit
MQNFPYNQNPKTWADYYGHEQAVSVAKQFLTQEPLQTLFISGFSGVGKTAFVLLLIKAARCLNRPPDSMEPCGHCANCKMPDPRKADPNMTDVWWIQEGGNTDLSIGKSINAALAAANKGQKFTGKTDDIMFIVFDEFQQVNRKDRSPLLPQAEVKDERSNVCYIFITMEEERLDLVELTAFKRRAGAGLLQFRPFTQIEIYGFLLNRFLDCPAETASLISKDANGSPGYAITLYDCIKSNDETLSPEVAAKVLSCATNKQRSKLWAMLYTKQKYVELNGYLERLARVVSIKQLAKQLVDDVLNTIERIGVPDEPKLLAIRLLNQYLANSSNTSLASYLIQLYGLEVASKEGIYASPDTSLEVLK